AGMLMISPASAGVRAYHRRIRNSVQNLAGALGNPHLLAILEELHPDPRRDVGLRVDDHQIGDVDRPRLLDDAALGHGLVDSRLDMTLDDRHALDPRPHLAPIDLQDLPDLPLVAARDHLHGVALLDAYLRAPPGRAR